MGSHLPKCPECGGTTFSFREVLGPSRSRERLLQPFAELEVHVRACEQRIQQFESQLATKLKALEENTADAIEKLKLAHTKKIDEAINDDTEGVLQYLMEPTDETPHFERDRAEIQAKLQAKSVSLSEQVDVRIQELREEVSVAEATFLRISSWGLQAVIFCEECGLVVGTSSAPSTEKAQYDKLAAAEKRLEIIEKQTAIMAKEMRTLSQNVDQGIGTLNKTVAKAAEAIFKAITAPRTGVSVEWEL